MRIRASVISHPGWCRGKNEDNFFLNGTILEKDAVKNPQKVNSRTKSAVLLGVFDGMGGISVGEMASRMTAQTADKIFKESNLPASPEMLEMICRTANEAVCETMLEVVKKRMGSTASLLLLLEDDCYVCNIGDSPIFLLRDGELCRLSYEHTEKEQYIQQYSEGKLPPKKKFRLTQHIGVFPQEMEIEPFIRREKLRAGDKFLICSDGLTDMVAQEDIAFQMNRKQSLSRLTRKLLQMALDNGGKDNITVLIAEVRNDFRAIFAKKTNSEGTL